MFINVCNALILPGLLAKIRIHRTIFLHPIYFLIFNGKFPYKKYLRPYAPTKIPFEKYYYKKYFIQLLHIAYFLINASPF